MLRCVLAALCALCVMACGGGSSSSSSSAPPAAPSQGTLTVLLGDDPSDDFDQVILTVDAVRLIGASDHVIRFDEAVTVDLLELRNLTETLVQSDVPAGTYSKVRLEISDLALNTLDDNDQVATTQRPPLPANGHIDLNPQGDFELTAGADLVIEVDLDVDRSLKLTNTGTGEYRFRPVVFVDILVEQDDGRLSRLGGEIQNLDGNTFELCDGDTCVPVELGANAPLMDSVGEAAAAGALMDGMQVTVFGNYVEDEASEVRVLQAIALVMVPLDDLEDVEGSVAAAPIDGAFTLNDDDDDDEDSVPVELLAGAVVLDPQENPTDVAAIVAAAELEGWGLPVPGSDVIRLVLVKLEDADDEDEDEVEGTLLAVQG